MEIGGVDTVVELLPGYFPVGTVEASKAGPLGVLITAFIDPLCYIFAKRRRLKIYIMHAEPVLGTTGSLGVMET